MRPLPLLLLLTLSLSAALAVALPSPTFQSSSEKRRTRSLGQVDASTVEQPPRSPEPPQPDSLDMFGGSLPVEGSSGSSDGDGKDSKKSGGFLRKTLNRITSGGGSKPQTRTTPGSPPNDTPKPSSEKLPSIGWFGRTKNSEKKEKPEKISKSSENRRTFSGRSNKDEISVFEPFMPAPMSLKELDRIVSLLTVLMLQHTTVEGLTRLSGNDVKAGKLLKQLKSSAGAMQSAVFYDTKRSRDALTEAGFDDLANTAPHDLSSTLKKAMMEYSQGCIIPDALWTALYEASQSPEEGQRLEMAVQALAHNPLDPYTTHILGMSLHLMSKIVAQKDQNKLDLEGVLLAMGLSVFNNPNNERIQMDAGRAFMQAKNADGQKKPMDVAPAHDVGKLLFNLFNQGILSQLTEIRTYPEGLDLPLIAEMPLNARLIMQQIPSDQLYSVKVVAESSDESNKERSSSGGSSPERKTEESEEDLPEKDEALTASTQLKLQMTKSI